MGSRRRSKPQHLAAKLLAIRQQLGVTQLQMAQMLEFPAYCRLSEYESGRREPSVLLILKYARVAKVPMESLIDDNLDLHF